MICKICGKNKGEDAFYLKGHYVNGKYYVSFAKTCKKCMSLIRIGKIEKKKQEEQLNPIKEKPIVKQEVTEVKPKLNQNDLWIIRNLRNYGNCLVCNKLNHDFGLIEKILGRKIEFTVSKSGYIISI